jgi:hypothetical protein
MSVQKRQGWGAGSAAIMKGGVGEGVADAAKRTSTDAGIAIKGTRDRKNDSLKEVMRSRIIFR